MTETPVVAYPPAHHILRDLGLATEIGPGLVSRGHIEVDGHLRTGTGLTHAGAIATLPEYFRLEKDAKDKERWVVVSAKDVPEYWPGAISTNHVCGRSVGSGLYGSIVIGTAVRAGSGSGTSAGTAGASRNFEGSMSSAEMSYPRVEYDMYTIDLPSSLTSGAKAPVRTLVTCLRAPVAKV